MFSSVWVIPFSTFLLSSTKISWKSTLLTPFYPSVSLFIFYLFIYSYWFVLCLEIWTKCWFQLQKDEMDQISCFWFWFWTWFTGLIFSWTMPFSLKISTNLCKIFCFTLFYFLISDSDSNSDSDRYHVNYFQRFYFVIVRMLFSIILSLACLFWLFQSFVNMLIWFCFVLVCILGWLSLAFFLINIF